MAEKPNKNNSERCLTSDGPRHRKDICNPQIGGDGADVSVEYSVNNNKDICLTSFTEGGTYKLHSDNQIEIVAGSKTPEGGIDIVIASSNGDITITAMKNGSIRIKGANIMIKADEDIDLNAGRNINLNACSGRILLNGNKADVVALAGNLVESTTGNFCTRAFTGSEVISQLGKDAFGNLASDVVGSFNTNFITQVGLDYLKLAGGTTGIGVVANVIGNVADNLLTNPF